MKIRATVELIDYLGNNKQERKRELISISQDLSPGQGDPPARIRRAAIVFAYAHWEGFVKDAARAYVRLVSHKSRGLSSLAPCFQALACRQELVVAQTATRRIQPHLAVVKRLVDDFGRSCRIDADAAIDTESNLTSIVFENICYCIGIDYRTNWAPNGPFMDDMFRSRCEVAHGEIYTPEQKYAQEAIQFSIRSIDRFSTDIENAAMVEAFLRGQNQVQRIAPADASHP